MDNIIRELFEHTASQTGQDFFDALVRNMSRIFGTKGAWVTEYMEKDHRLISRSFWYGGNFVREYCFQIAGSPCETVFSGKQLVHIPDNLVKLYPDANDPYTQETVSYMGVAILDDDQSIMGHLAVLDEKPLFPDSGLIDVFKLFAGRAAAELKRIKAEKHLHLQMQSMLDETKISMSDDGRNDQNSVRQEDLIVMFLDLNSSTTIAEKLGNDLFFDLVREFINDVTMPIIKNLGIIYKYVGDEIIAIWKIGEGLRNANCLNCYFETVRVFEDRKDFYQQQFGIIPGFKAGMHCGKVTIGSIGSVVKETVYSGDVLNTASRITNMCNTLGAKLLISEELATHLLSHGEFSYRKFEKINLKGKLKKASLYEFSR